MKRVWNVALILPVVAQRDSQKTLSDQIAKDYGSLSNAPRDVRKRYNELSSQYCRTITELSESIVKVDREAYRDQRAESLFSKNDTIPSKTAEPAPADTEGEQDDPSEVQNMEVVSSPHQDNASGTQCIGPGHTNGLGARQTRNTRTS